MTIASTQKAVLDPKPKTSFRIFNNRLSLFHAADDPVDYWRTYWDNAKRSELAQRGKSGDLGEFGGIVEQHVPRDAFVLEAGCGPGHVAAALKQRGYTVSGIDYEQEVLRFAKSVFPEVDFCEGNVLQLDYDDGAIGCYISIGVVEHFMEGPQRALAEARRVLKEDGVAIISVPYLNPARRCHLEAIRNENGTGEDLHFHQYYFGINEFSTELRQAGLEVIDLFPYGVEAFLRREHPWFSRFWRSSVCREQLKRIFRGYFKHTPSWMRFRYAHMITFICKPTRRVD